MRTFIWLVVLAFFLAIVKMIRDEARRQHQLSKEEPAIEPEVIRELPPAPIYNIQINHQHHEHNSYIIVTDPPKNSNRNSNKSTGKTSNDDPANL